jgi:hypothetical protein
VTPTTLPGGTVGIAYSQTLAASGGTGQYAFGVAAGSLPAGLTLTATGQITGTPSTAGQSNLTIRATDASGCPGTVSYAIAIAAAVPVPPGCPALTFTPAALPNGTAGVAYSQAIGASGGTGPYSFGVAAGALPAGLTLTGSGLVEGTPTTAGQANVTIRGTDASGCPGTVVYRISILNAVPTLPQALALVLASLLGVIGYARLRRRVPARQLP